MQHLTPTEAAARAADNAIYRAAAAARETQLAAAVAALRAEHPELEAPTPERDSLVTAAANLRAFIIEVRTAAGQLSRYDALAPDACAALLDALDLWGLAKINVSPRGEP